MCVPDDEIKDLKIPGFECYQCTNCGSTGETKSAIQHYSNCKPGKAKKWEKYYEDFYDCSDGVTGCGDK